MSLADQSAQALRKAVIHLMMDLPVLPVCTATLTRSGVSEDEHIDDILSLATVEPCLSSRIFQIAAKVMPSHSISSIRQAMMLVGSRAVDDLITAHLQGQVFHPANDEERCMWAHFLLVSIASRRLAVQYKALGVNPQQALEAGLLHDLGRLVQYENLAKSPSELEKHSYQNPDELIRAEEMVFGASHVRLGTIAADIIKLPAFVRACIDHHHSEPSAIPRKTAKEFGQLIEIVTIADEIAMFCHRWPIEDFVEFTHRAEHFLKNRSVYLKHVKPNLDEVYQIMKSSYAEAQQSFLQLDLGPMPELDRGAHQMLYS